MRHFALANVRWLLCAVLVSVCALPSSIVSGQNARRSAPRATSSKSPAESENAPLSPPTIAAQAIPLPEIPDRAEELHNHLLDIYKQLSATQESLPSESATQARADEIRERAGFVDVLIAGVPTSLELRDEDQYWFALDREYMTHRKLLTLHATTLQDQVQFLESQRLIWQITWDQIRQTRGIGPVIERVQKELESIKSTHRQVQEQLNRVLTLQNQISQDEQQITDVLTKLARAREQLVRHLFERDGHPLWNARELRKLDRPMLFSILPTVNRDLRDSETFLGLNGPRVFGILVCYGLALLALFRLKRRVASVEVQQVSPEIAKVLSRPCAVALMLTLVLTIGRLQTATSGIAFIFAFLWLIATLRLLPGLIGPEPRSLLYAFVPILFLEATRILIPFSTVVKRDIFVLNMLLSIGLFAWLIRPARLHQQRFEGQKARVFVLTVRVGIALLAAAFATNLFGFLSLSQVLAMVVLLGFFGGAALYCAVRVLSLLLSVICQTAWVRTTLQTRAAALERWVNRVLLYGAVLVWLNGLLRLLTIHDKVTTAISDGLHYRFGYGPVQFTVGGTLSVVMILGGGFAFAKVITFVLQKILLPRLPLQRGVSYAVSTVTYYLLLLLVAGAGLADAGVELNKFTMLTGAIGVGLGFGLQNVVNNFVSGLILLFERPIHVGDTVDVGGLVGTVRRIGARSSTVLTFQGAEVIVPNSNLLSNQVINWTLSSQWRRVDIPVLIAFGTDPERVLKLLVEVAESHAGVLRERPPTAFFLGFGENGLNFELRFWSASQDTWFQLQSDVAVAVAKALREAEIEIPFPQRDLHLRSVDPSIRQVLAGNGLDDSSFVYSPTPGHSASTQSTQAERDAKGNE